MKKAFLLIIAVTVICYSSIAQTDITIGKTYTITSKVLNQEREVNVYLPDGHDDATTKYPVLYILDGQWYFTNGVAIQKSLRTPGPLPEMIVVGIQNQNPLRRTLFGEDRDKFLSFLEKEVFSFVENTFKASDERVLFGWEASAYFACYALLNDKQLFNATIATNGAYVTPEMIDEYSKLNTTTKKYLFIAGSTKDIYSIDESDFSGNSLKEASTNNLVWEYRLFNDEVHESLAHLALYHGLQHYYHNYNSLVFGSIKEFNELGGVVYLKDYFKKRGERYGFPTEIDNSTKNSLIWLAWNRDDYESFHLYMAEFEDVLSTKRYESAYWQNRLAQFYLKHNDHENAIKFFNTGITAYSESSRLAEMHFGIGSAYLGQGNKKTAIKHYKKAVEIAEKNGDPKLVSYKQQLSELKK